MTQISNLFSVFDPSAIFSLTLNWVSSLGVLSFIPSVYWARKSDTAGVFLSLLKYLGSEFSAVLGATSAPGLTLLPISLCIFIAFNNILGLLPFVFTASSHLTYSFGLALSLWTGYMALAWTKTPTHMFAHLVPLGTPPLLMPFMVVIEVISSVIRPLTLSVRLAANMVAGHLLLTLLGNQAPSSGYLPFIVVYASLILLLTLESAVAVIQAYVFSTLSTLYFSEVNSPALSFK